MSEMYFGLPDYVHGADMEHARTRCSDLEAAAKEGRLVPDKSQIAHVTLPDGRELEAVIHFESWCTVHNCVPGWGCEGCREFTDMITKFTPLGGSIPKDKP